jgi:hypothetical protein
MTALTRPSAAPKLRLKGGGSSWGGTRGLELLVFGVPEGRDQRLGVGWEGSQVWAGGMG